MAILARAHQLTRLGKEQEHSFLQAWANGHLPGERINTLAEASALAWARVAEAHCRVDDGLRVAEAWSRRVLGLTEGTVKWYLQQVFDKLGVRKRSLAVDRARRFGIIHASSQRG